MNLTAAQAAKRINRPITTVRWWCKSGHLKAQKWGRDWMIDEASLLKFTPPKVGRPRKELNAPR